MAGAPNPDVPTDEMGERAIFLSRLSAEIATLGDMARTLQDGLHNLPLEQSDQQTRTILQSADRLTQSLDCLSAAIEGLSDLPISTQDYDMTSVLSGVFLEDLRERLTKGPGALLDGRNAPGEVDLF